MLHYLTLHFTRKLLLSSICFYANSNMSLTYISHRVATSLCSGHMDELLKLQLQLLLFHICKMLYWHLTAEKIGAVHHFWVCIHSIHSGKCHKLHWFIDITDLCILNRNKYYCSPTFLWWFTFAKYKFATIPMRKPVGKSSESVQCAITGRCLRMRHRPSG